MSKSYPTVPQVGRQPITLTSEQEKKLLSRRVPTDRSDPFATDANDEVRTLGKLALRRGEPDPIESLALGDLCARLSLVHDELLILYVGKSRVTYRRAEQQWYDPGNQKIAHQAAETFIQWVIDVAHEAPTPRNIAVALWAAADIPEDRQPKDL